AVELAQYAMFGACFLTPALGPAPYIGEMSCAPGPPGARSQQVKAALAEVAPDPARSPDRLSARWLLALAARLVRETGALINGAARASKPLATFGLDAEVRFAKPADRAAFVGELTDTITGIISKYHTETGRPHRLIVAVHPGITENADPPAEEQQS
ncbi:MAG: hypothetical protein ACRDTV_08830, partial [Mycobacterium sp.]